MAARIKAYSTCPLKIRPAVIAAAALIFFILSCGSHRQVGETGLQDVNRADGPRHNPLSSQIQKQLEAEYRRWQETPHRLGGNSRNGVDCSGFVKAVYTKVFKMNLPRTTQGQVTIGRPVKKTELQAGDLVFFKPPSYPRHVGIYLNNSQFMHASKTKGVTISEISPYYWGKYYWTARRLLVD